MGLFPWSRFLYGVWTETTGISSEYSASASRQRRLCFSATDPSTIKQASHCPIYKSRSSPSAILSLLCPFALPNPTKTSFRAGGIPRFPPVVERNSALSPHFALAPSCIHCLVIGRYNSLSNMPQWIYLLCHSLTRSLSLDGLY